MGIQRCALSRKIFVRKLSTRVKLSGNFGEG